MSSPSRKLARCACRRIGYVDRSRYRRELSTDKFPWTSARPVEIFSFRAASICDFTISIQALLVLEIQGFRTSAMAMKWSSHQKGAAESFRAVNRATTATVARTTLMMLPTQTFQAMLSSGGRGMFFVAMMSELAPSSADGGKVVEAPFNL